MSIAANDVNVISVKTADLDFRTDADIPVTVEAEVGSALFNTGGRYRVRMTMTDRTSPALLHQDEIFGNYGDTNWPSPAGLRTFSFTVPGAVTKNRAGNLIEPQAQVIGNTAAPFDVSYTVGELILLTP